MNRKNIETRLSKRAQNLSPSPIRKLVPYLSIEGMISLGGGYPDARTFPMESLKAEMKGGGSIALDTETMPAASQYGPSNVQPVLEKEIIRWHRAKDGIALEKGSFLSLNGAQEGLFIAAYLFLDDEDSVALSEPTYPGALAAFRAFTRRFVSIPLDGEGIDTNALDSALEKMQKTGEKLPKLIYTIPTGHNPGGVSLSLERRQELLDIARRYDILLLEDDPYQLIRLDDKAPRLPTLQSLDKDNRVIRLDSFSKIFAPGLRLGYASGPPEIIERFVLFKQAANLHTSSFSQTLLAQFLSREGPSRFFERIDRNCAHYRSGRDAMIEAAAETLPDSIGFNRPGEGFFVWFRMPEKCSSSRMIGDHSERLKVIVVPGSGFSSQGELDNCVRASFATAPPDDIREGMHRFARMVQKEFERAGI